MQILSVVYRGGISLMALLIALLLITTPLFAADSLQAAAENGDREAQYQLAIKILQNHEQPNFPAAVKWLTAAAENGHAEAQYSLALRYLLGQGVEKNPKVAADWLQLAAEQGHADAQYSLGLRYLWGQGRAKDLALAQNWLQQAAAQGQKEAEEQLVELPTETTTTPPLPQKQQTEELIAAYAKMVFADAADAETQKEKLRLERQLTPKEVMLAIQAATQKKWRIKDRLQLAQRLAKRAGQLTTAEDYFLAGNRLVRDGELQLAALAFEQSLELAPNNPSSLRNLASAYAHLGEMDKAIENLRKSLAFSPEDASKRATLGLTYQVAGKNELALAEYRQAATLNPGLAWFYPDMADIFIQQQNYPAAWLAVRQAELMGHGRKRIRARLEKLAPTAIKATEDPNASSLHLRQLTLASREGAETTLQQLREGVDFNRLLPRLASEGQLVSSGYWGPYQPELLAPQINSALEGLPPFSFSPIIETPAGFHILQKFLFFHDLAQKD